MRGRKAGPRFLHHVHTNINRLRKPKHRERTLSRTADTEATTLAEHCLGQLAEDPAQLAEFMATVGYTPDRLRAALGSDQLARGLIDYFAQNESLMLALCANRGLRPEEFMRVWHRLNPAG